MSRFCRSPLVTKVLKRSISKKRQSTTQQNGNWQGIAMLLILEKHGQSANGAYEDTCQRTREPRPTQVVPNQLHHPGHLNLLCRVVGRGWRPFVGVWNSFWNSFMEQFHTKD